ncbi:MAG: hypothetical protein WCK28_19770 [Burkholderiales bacterium]
MNRPVVALPPALPDLLQPRALPAVVPRLIAVLGVIVACVGTARVWQAEQRLALASAEHEAASLLAGGRAVKAPAATPTQATAPRAARPRAERAAPAAGEGADAERVALARFLSVDWNHRLLVVEEAGSGLVSLTGLKVDGGRGALELRGETLSLERFETMRRRLLEAGVGTVQLSRHEVVQRPGGTRLAFVATAEWSR